MVGIVNLRTWTVTAFLSCVILASQAAENTSATVDAERFLPWEKGSVKFGGFIAAFNSDLGFGIGDAAGVTIDAEDLFGLDSSLTVFRADATYRPGKSLRHQLDFTYASYHRDGSATLSEELDINGDGNPIPVGAKVDTVFNFDIIRGTYSYALLQDDRMRISLGLGVYAVPLRYELDIQTAGGRSQASGADTTLPLPALALRGEFQLLRKLYLYASVDAMYLQVSDFRGSLLDTNVGLEYRPWKHVGFGLGFNGMSVNVEADGSNSDYPGVDFVGTVDVRFSGLMLYGKLSF